MKGSHLAQMDGRDLVEAVKAQKHLQVCTGRSGGLQAPQLGLNDTHKKQGQGQSTLWDFGIRTELYRAPQEGCAGPANRSGPPLLGKRGRLGLTVRKVASTRLKVSLPVSR